MTLIGSRFRPGARTGRETLAQSFPKWRRMPPVRAASQGADVALAGDANEGKRRPQARAGLLSSCVEHVFERPQTGRRGVDEHRHVARLVLVLPHLSVG